jgi:DNA polymerase IIIc chi subunit
MAAGPLVQLGNNNSYIQQNDTRLVVEFSRNPKDFSLPNYIQIRPVPKQRGYYLAIDQYQAMRLVGGSLDDFVWPDGHPRPKPRTSGQEFNWRDYQTIRRNFGQPIGDLARQQADWDAEDTQEAIQAQQAMTARTLLVHAALGTQANWDASHWSNVTAIPGVAGTWDAALSSNLYIKKSINYGVKQIMLDTASKVRRKDLRLVINPTTAIAISQTQEIVDMIKQSPDAYSNLVNNEGRWSEYGLPNKLYGVEIVVEDAVTVATPKGATPTASFVMPDGVAYLLSRVGGLQARGGGPSFSTVTLFAKEEMTITRDAKTYDRYLDIDVVDDVGVGLTATSAGFAFRSALT